MGSVQHKHQLTPGTIISDRYQVVCRIGSGGMGTVYEVRHRRLDRQFAAKVLAHDLSNDYTSLARFRREAEVVAGLRHPNIVDIVDWEHLDDGTPCIIMEYLHGESLGDRIQRIGALPWSEVLAIGQQVANALSIAHREGIVHRDLKPDNIYLARTENGEEMVKLLDFGVSKIRHSNTLATQDFALLGTPAYMSPEQADSRSDEIDETTDLWALGAILYEMASNRPAFLAESVPSLLYKVCHSDPPPIGQYRPDASTGFLELLERALSRERSRRFASAEDLRIALEHALSGPALSGRGGAPVMVRAITEGGVVLRMPAHHQHTTFSQASGQTQTAHVSGKRRRGLSLLFAIALLGAGLAVGLLVARSGSGGESAPAAVPTGAASQGRVDISSAASGAGEERDAGPAAGVVGADSDVGDDPPEPANRDGVDPDSKRTNDRDAQGKKIRKGKRKGKRKRKIKRSTDSTDTSGKPIDRKKGEPVNPFANPVSV